MSTVFLLNYLSCITTLWGRYTFLLLDQFSLIFSLAAHSCLTLCDPMDCSTPGLSVHHQLLEFTQTHVHWVGDAIQPSHPLLSPSPPALHLSQHQGLFKCQLFTSDGQSIGISASTSVLPVNTQDWSPLSSKYLSTHFSPCPLKLPWSETHWYFSIT